VHGRYRRRRGGAQWSQQRARFCIDAITVNFVEIAILRNAVGPEIKFLDQAQMWVRCSVASRSSTLEIRFAWPRLCRRKARVLVRVINLRNSSRGVLMLRSYRKSGDESIRWK
jgi:hypothetical protein